jgi:hypothetical protein
MTEGTGDAALASFPSLWPHEIRCHDRSGWDAARVLLRRRFAESVYGHTPSGGGVAAVERLAVEDDALDGLAVRHQMEVRLTGTVGDRTMVLMLYVPAPATSSLPAPVFVCLNFHGNQTVEDDPRIRTSNRWTDREARGSAKTRWPLAEIIRRGYAVATVNYMDLEPDRPDSWSIGVRGMFDDRSFGGIPTSSRWGALGAWSWGMSRIVDVVGRIPTLDSTRIIAVGHSRLGKAALWSAAQDDRYAAVVSNESGCGGASLFRHESGETITQITDAFPHWFCSEFNRYRADARSLPVDQHQLLGIIAPRAIHVASALSDAHADPRGEFLTTVLASPIMRLYSFDGTAPAEWAHAGEDIELRLAKSARMPTVGHRVGARLSYHVRTGDHDIRAEDWRHFLTFADETLNGSSQPADTA